MTTDNLSINPHVFLLPLRTPYFIDYDFYRVFSEKHEEESRRNPGLNAFLQSLSERRSTLVTVLTNPNEREESLDTSLDSYLSLLNHLMVSSDVVNVTERQSRDSNLTHAFEFAWNECFAANVAVKLSDVRFEIISVLLAAALFKARKGAKIFAGQSTGVNSLQASKMFKLYREAAGYIDHCLKIAPQLKESYNSTISTDCNENFLKALRDLLLAEVQSVTVLRSVAKGNAPSLIASLAMQVYNQYVDAINTLECSVSKSHPDICKKLHAYLKYKSCCFHTYVLCYHAWSKLSGSAGGQAVKLALAAEEVISETGTLGKAYDQAHPVTDISERQGFQEVMEGEIKKVRSQAETDNRLVYLETVPSDLPEMPLPKQLVAALAFEYPAPDTSVNRKIFLSIDASVLEKGDKPIVIEIMESKPASITKEKERDEEEKVKGSECWRWLLVIIALPFLFIICILGLLFWIILLPIKTFCCPVGFVAQALWNITEYIIKAPAKLLLWASGKPWKTQTKMGEDV